MFIVASWLVVGSVVGTVSSIPISDNDTLLKTNTYSWSLCKAAVLKTQTCKRHNVPPQRVYGIIGKQWTKIVISVKKW